MQLIIMPLRAKLVKTFGHRHKDSAGMQMLMSYTF